METIYSGFWAGQNCLLAAVKVFLIAAGVLMATVMLLTWLALMGTRGGARAARLLKLVMSMVAVGLVGIAAFVAFSGGPTYHRVAFGGGVFLFEGCHGTTAIAARVAAGEIAVMTYRQRWSGGRSPRRIDEVVLATRDRGEFAIPLSVDGEASRHETLARLLPRPVIDDYVAALRERGTQPPAALAAGQ